MVLGWHLTESINTNDPSRRRNRSSEQDAGVQEAYVTARYFLPAVGANAKQGGRFKEAHAGPGALDEEPCGQPTRAMIIRRRCCVWNGRRTIVVVPTRTSSVQREHEELELGVCQ
jgi:hypothetical protein